MRDVSRQTRRAQSGHDRSSAETRHCRLSGRRSTRLATRERRIREKSLHHRRHANNTDQTAAPNPSQLTTSLPTTPRFQSRTRCLQESGYQHLATCSTINHSFSALRPCTKAGPLLPDQTASAKSHVEPQRRGSTRRLLVMGGP